MSVKSGFIKVISAAICIVTVFTAIMFVRAGASGAQKPAILYYNDRQWTLSDPEVNTSGVYYIPLTVFAQLPSVSVRINKTLQTFIITHGDLYLSFDTATDFAANQDKIRTPIKTYEREGERYVPAAIVCAYLELSYEELKNPSTGAAALRITDGSEQYSLSTLLRRRNPGFFADTTETEGVITVTPPVTEPPSLDDRTVYIVIENCPGQYTGDVLDVLKKYGHTAVFVTSGSRASDDPAMLSEMLAGGHTVALGVPDESVTPDARTAPEVINSENKLLAKLTKQKTRILFSSPGEKPSDEVNTALHEAGYIVWDANVNIPSGYGSRSASSAAINGIRNNEIAILRLTETAHTADTLKRVFDFILENSEACKVHVISPALDENIN